MAREPADHSVRNVPIEPAHMAHLFALPSIDDEPDDVGEDLEADPLPPAALLHAVREELERAGGALWEDSTPEKRSEIVFDAAVVQLRLAAQEDTPTEAEKLAAFAALHGSDPAEPAAENYVPDWIFPPEDAPDAPDAIHSGAGDAPAAGMNFRTAADLFTGLPETTSWRVDGLIPDGAITELDGPAKRAGKTTFMAHLIRAVLDGAPFLGREVRQGPVVLLSEQPVTSLRASLTSAGLLEREDLWILLWGDAIGVPWAQVAGEALELCGRIGAGLLVTDTLPQFAGLRGDAENDAGAALQAIEPLQRAAATGLAVVVVRHDRKGSGEVGESARGSSAFGGAVDVILQLRRGGPDERPTIRYLSALSRFTETPAQLVIELGEDGYVELGDAAGYARAEAKARILAELADQEMRRDDIAKAVGIDGERLTDALAELVAGGFLVRAGRGVKGDPQRFSRNVPIHSGGAPTTWAPPNRMESAPVPAEPDYVAAVLDIFGDVLVDGAS